MRDKKRQQQQQAGSAAPASVRHMTREQAEALARAQPGSRVYGWSEGAEAGPARADAFGTVRLGEILEALKRAVVDRIAARPGLNELMLRWELSREAVPGGGAGGDAGAGAYTWGDFAQHYPTFWAKLTSASTTRSDVIILHVMLDARRRLETGELATEQEVNELIYSDMIAMNIKADKAANARNAGNASASGLDERTLLQRARMRRQVLRRTYEHVLVPTEELARRGIPFKAATSVLHEIRAEDEARKERLQRDRAAQSRRKAAVDGLTAQDITFGRMLLRVRTELAKRCDGLPEPLDPRGASYMPTFVRSAQLGLAWKSGDGAEVPVPPEMAMAEAAEA